jgi:small subunit ribosomal protein S6
VAPIFSKNKPPLWFVSPNFLSLQACLKTKEEKLNMANQYETTIIVSPVLTDAELKKEVSNHVKFLKSNKAEIVHEHNWGLKPLAYPIEKKTTGFYFTVEYKAPVEVIPTFELNLKRDENVMRFLTIRLDKFAIDYNEKKRKGLIGRKRNQEETTTEKAEA